MGRVDYSKDDIIWKSIKSCLDDGCSLRFTADKCNVSRSTINRLMKKYGYVFTPKSRKELLKNTLADKHIQQDSALWRDIKGYLDEGYSKTYVAAKFNIDKRKVNRMIKEFDYDYDSSNIPEKRKLCVQEKYGVDFPLQSSLFMSKKNDTCLARYNTAFPQPDDSARERQRLTMLERYGGCTTLQSPELREKVINTNLERYGFCYPLENSDFRFSYYSPAEQELYQILLTKFPDVIHHFTSELYPFECDFYIPSRGLYIELNISWVHGEHWFDTRNPNDIAWRDYAVSRSIESSYYKRMVETWTGSDVLKRKTASQNHLKYLVFWDKKMEDVNDWILCGCPDGYDWAIEYSWKC